MLPNAQAHRLPNGVRLVTVPMANKEVICAMVGIRTGKRVEDGNQPGLAHLTEHLVFKGTRHYPSSADVEGTIASIGGQVNASTTHEYTYYTVLSPVAGGQQAVDVLADMIMRPLLPEAELETEREVVRVELRHLTQDQANWSIFLMQNLMWRNQPLAWDLQASLDAVDHLTASDVQAFIRRWYIGSNTVVVLAGGTDMLNSLVRHAAMRFRDMPYGRSQRWSRVSFSGHPRSMSLVLEGATETTMRLGVPGLPFGGRDGERLHLIDYLLGRGSTSRLYQRLREKHGLVYQVMTDSTFFTDAGMLTTVTETASENAHRVLSMILEEQASLASGSISREELERAKAEYFGEMSILTNDPVGLGCYYMENVLIGGRMRQLQAHRRTVETATLPEVQRLARRILGAKPYLVTIGPKELRLP